MDAFGWLGTVAAAVTSALVDREPPPRHVDLEPREWTLGPPPTRAPLEPFPAPPGTPHPQYLRYLEEMGEKVVVVSSEALEKLVGDENVFDTIRGVIKRIAHLAFRYAKANGLDPQDGAPVERWTLHAWVGGPWNWLFSIDGIDRDAVDLLYYVLTNSALGEGYHATWSGVLAFALGYKPKNEEQEISPPAEAPPRIPPFKRRDPDNVVPIEEQKAAFRALAEGLGAKR